MSDIKTICCPVDFSECSRVALEEAAALARRYECDLVLVHAHEVPAATTADMMLSPPEFFEQAVRELERKLEAWRRDAEELAGRPVRAELLTGRVTDEILNSAGRHSADLIVIGTHGRAGVKRLVLGSVAEHVVRHAGCPVLVMRRKGAAG